MHLEDVVFEVKTLMRVRIRLLQMFFSDSLPFKAATLSAWLVRQPKVTPKIMASVQQINETSNRKAGPATGLRLINQVSLPRFTV